MGCKGSTKTLESAVREFILDGQIGGCTKASIEAYHWQLQPFIQWAKTRNVTLPSMTGEHLREFLVFRSAVGKADALSHATVRLKTFFRWCAEHQLFRLRPRELDFVSHARLKAGHQCARRRGTPRHAFVLSRKRLRQSQE